jgi:hypothetical protein
VVLSQIRKAPDLSLASCARSKADGAVMFKAPVFVHRQAVPLALADLTKIDQQPNLFNNECEGMCGV